MTRLVKRLLCAVGLHRWRLRYHGWSSRCRCGAQWIHRLVWLALVIRKCHLIRPDLIPYPILVETYC
jgi:hypothetical protein